MDFVFIKNWIKQNQLRPSGPRSGGGHGASVPVRRDAFPFPLRDPLDQVRGSALRPGRPEQLVDLAGRRRLLLVATVALLAALRLAVRLGLLGLSDLGRQSADVQRELTRGLRELVRGLAKPVGLVGVLGHLGDGLGGHLLEHVTQGLGAGLVVVREDATLGALAQDARLDEPLTAELHRESRERLRQDHRPLGARPVAGGVVKRHALPLLRAADPGGDAGRDQRGIRGRRQEAQRAVHVVAVLRESRPELRDDRFVGRVPAGGRLVGVAGQPALDRQRGRQLAGLVDRHAPDARRPDGLLGDGALLLVVAPALLVPNPLLVPAVLSEHTTSPPLLHLGRDHSYPTLNRNDQVRSNEIGIADLVTICFSTKSATPISSDIILFYLNVMFCLKLYFA